MKRTPLRRHTELRRGDSELARGPGPKRKTEIRKVRPDRKRRLFVDQFGDVARVRWFQMQECAVPLCGGWPSECAHVVSRGAGGTAEDIIPLCAHHHTEQHAVGVQTFAGTYHMDLAALAEDYDARYRLAQGRES